MKRYANAIRTEYVDWAEEWVTEFDNGSEIWVRPTSTGFKIYTVYNYNSECMYHGTNQEHAEWAVGNHYVGNDDGSECCC